MRKLIFNSARSTVPYKEQKIRLEVDQTRRPSVVLFSWISSDWQFQYSFRYSVTSARPQVFCRLVPSSQLSVFCVIFWSQEGRLVPGFSSSFKTRRILGKASLGTFLLGLLEGKALISLLFQLIDQNESHSHLVLHAVLGNDLPGFVVSARGSTWKKLMTAAGNLVTASALFITIYNDNIGVVSLWSKKAPFTGAFHLIQTRISCGKYANQSSN